MRQQLNVGSSPRLQWELFFGGMKTEYAVAGSPLGSAYLSTSLHLIIQGYACACVRMRMYICRFFWVYIYKHAYTFTRKFVKSSILVKNNTIIIIML